jgi:hypothetical protein
MIHKWQGHIVTERYYQWLVRQMIDDIEDLLELEAMAT